jgi:hypothetical protein
MSNKIIVRYTSNLDLISIIFPEDKIFMVEILLEKRAAISPLEIAFLIQT